MKIPPWSFSTISAYETCPLKYYASKVSKEFPEKPTEATTWGNRVHTAMEHRVVKKTPLPEGMGQWEEIAALFDSPGGQVLVEKRLSLNKQFQPCAWDSSWVRGIVDIGVLKEKTGKAYDWKTGKPKTDSLQMKLFAALMMHSYPYLENVKTGFVWLINNTMTEAKYTRDELPSIWEEFLPKVHRWERAYELDKWEPKPSGLCKQYCPNLKCNFNGRR